jgi:hypothetical protein
MQGLPIMSTVGLVNLGKLHKNAPQKFSTFGVLYVLYLFYLTAMVEFIETFGMCFLCGLFPPYHLDRLEPHPSWLHQSTFPDREDYNAELIGLNKPHPSMPVGIDTLSQWRGPQCGRICFIGLRSSAEVL